MSKKLDLGPVEVHPFGDYIPERCRKLIVGSFPIGKFTNPKRSGEINDGEINFYYGGSQNLLWSLLGDCFGRKLTSKEAIKEELSARNIGISDVIHSCQRHKGSASDADLHEQTWNHGLANIINENKIEKIYFTSQQVRDWYCENIKPNVVGQIVEVVLISPSGQASRGIGRNAEYKQWKLSYTGKEPTYDYRLEHYKKYFC